MLSLYRVVWWLVMVRWCNSASLTNRPLEAPRRCDWQRVSDGGTGSTTSAQVLMSCGVRTAAGVAPLLADLSASQAERVTALDLRCSDALFFESSLDIGGSDPLSRLKNLRELNIEHCKIRYVPASVWSPLQSLRTLTVRTHNTDWSAMSMEFHRDSFKGLNELRILDLADNNIWTLPTEVFCPLYNLKELNLTSNRLRDISSMGFSDWGDGPTAPGKSCNAVLETLDMSFNNFISMPDNGLSSLRSLQRLYLQNNLISEIADRAFVGLNDLQLLNMSSNRLEALPPEMFQSSRDIKQVYLNNNSLNVLAPGLLEGLDQLQILDLSQNQLTIEWVNRDTFSGLIRLIVLNLSHNKLSKVDSLLFQDLNNLQFLSLEHNAIAKISDEAFGNLKNLHSLSLAHNQLLEVDSTLFSNLYVLNQLFIDSNLISEIHPRSFENITKLQDLGLSGNRLNQVPEAIKRLRFLKSLDLGSNGISSVVSSQFEGLDDLYGLRLVGNLITNITKDNFVTLPSLQILNVASNKVNHVDEGAFASSPTLRVIRLDDNELIDIRGIFNNMNSLAWLNISDNKIIWFDYSHVPLTLEYLDMHKNQIQKIEDYYGVKENTNIKMLDASFNLLKSIDETALPTSVENVYLNNNEISAIKPGTFVNKNNLVKVVLVDNLIKSIEIGALAISSVPEDRDIAEFYLSGNPIYCDCNMEWLQRINQLSNLRQYPRVADLESIRCTLAHSKAKANVPLLEVRTSEFLCQYEAHCFALCHCCDFDACDCEMTCPDRCSCYHDLTWNSNVVDCSNAQYTRVPERIPMDATAIYLDGNNFKDLANHVFIGKKKLQVLFLNNSNIDTVQNRTFTGIESLRILHLENNNLERFAGNEFSKLRNLNELHLENNKLKVIQNNTFSNLPSLEILKLDNNGVVDFLPWKVLNDESPQAKISIEGNNWLCDCRSVIQLEQWLVDRGDDADKVLCYFSQGLPLNKTVASVAKECLKEIDQTTVDSVTLKHLFLDSSSLTENYIPYIAVVVILAVVILLSVALLFMFREEFKLWLHSKYGVRLLSCSSKEPTDSKECNYDAFVVYSLRDDDFVSRAVARELERSGRSLCLQHRDLQVTDRRLGDSIVGAVDSSSRLIIVLSISFLQNEWFNPEIKAAIESGINAINVRYRRQKIIFLVTTDLSAINIEPDLKVLLKTCTVIVWGERNCWEKLNFRLPDASATLPNRTFNSGEGKGNLTRMEAFGKQSNLRYTAPPSAHDSWYRGGAAGAASPAHSGYASADVSARSTEDETCSVASSEGRGPADERRHSYMSIESRPCEQRPLRSFPLPPPPPLPPCSNPHNPHVISHNMGSFRGPQNKTYFV